MEKAEPARKLLVREAGPCDELLLSSMPQK